jgi:hypothetical protein
VKRALDRALLPVASALVAAVSRPPAVPPQPDSSMRFHTYVEVALADRGQVIWYGHRLRPPYQFKMEDGTAALSVNGLPLLAPADSLRPARADSADSRRILSRRANISFVHGGSLDINPPFWLAESAAEVFRSRSDLVDSARARDAHSVWVYWKGEPPGFADAIFFPLEPDPGLGESRARLRAKRLARLLQDGATVFFGDGDRVVPPERWPQVEAEMAALRASPDTLQPRLLSPRLAEQVRRPPPYWKLIRKR